MRAQHGGEVAGRVADVGVEHPADGVSASRLRRRREAADLQRQIDVVGVVAEARQQEGIELFTEAKVPVSPPAALRIR